MSSLVLPRTSIAGHLLPFCRSAVGHVTDAIVQRRHGRCSLSMGQARPGQDGVGGWGDFDRTKNQNPTGALVLE